MVGGGSAGEPDRAQEFLGDAYARERRGLERCRRALVRGRRVRGRAIASDKQHGVLVDLRGALGHVPAGEPASRPGTLNALRGGEGLWEGWVVAVAGDLVHLSARRAGEQNEADPIRAGEVMSTARSGAVVRLDDGSLGVVPWEELSWEPALEAPELPRGARLEGRVVALTLDGPVLSPRAVTPSPWPAVALALPPGTAVTAHVEALARGHALLRTDRAPRAAAIVAEDALPDGAEPGTVLDATVARVNAGALVLADLSPTARAPRHARAAPKPAPRGPGPAASGSRS